MALRILSFFPTTEIISEFQQTVYPTGTTQLSSRPPQPIVTELDPNNLPEDFPFSLEELGMGGEDAPQELSMTQRLIGMTEPGKPPENVEVTIYTPGEEPLREVINPTKPNDDSETDAEAGSGNEE